MDKPTIDDLVEIFGPRTETEEFKVFDNAIEAEFKGEYYTLFAQNREGYVVCELKIKGLKGTRKIRIALFEFEDLYGMLELIGIEN